MWTSVPREVQDVALTPAAATLPEDSPARAMTDMPETAQPATVSQYVLEIKQIEKVLNFGTNRRNLTAAIAPVLTRHMSAMVPVRARSIALCVKL